jgi:hypothetical protein
MRDFSSHVGCSVLPKTVSVLLKVNFSSSFCFLVLFYISISGTLQVPGTSRYFMLKMNGDVRMVLSVLINHGHKDCTDCTDSSVR